ncbi:hypothetical protein, partial [uncultured Megasphaera sp.]|uniref:hypothetical protein n=1 Tax=uncultured Megasphaera sp. TaxID=165188 RepID=UPI002597D8B0
GIAVPSRIPDYDTRWKGTVIHLRVQQMHRKGAFEGNNNIYNKMNPFRPKCSASGPAPPRESLLQLFTFFK